MQIILTNRLTIRKGNEGTLGKSNTNAKIVADRCANRRHKVWLGAQRRSETYHRWETAIRGRNEEGNEGCGISKEEDGWNEENGQTGARIDGTKCG